MGERIFLSDSQRRLAEQNLKMPHSHPCAAENAIHHAEIFERDDYAAHGRIAEDSKPDYCRE